MYTIRITPKGRKFFHEVVDADGRCIGTRVSSHQYGFACVAVSNDAPDTPFVLSFNRKPAEVESYLRWKIRRIATAVLPA